MDGRRGKSNFSTHTRVYTAWLLLVKNAWNIYMYMISPFYFLSYSLRSLEEALGRKTKDGNYDGHWLQPAPLSNFFRLSSLSASMCSLFFLPYFHSGAKVRVVL